MTGETVSALLRRQAQRLADAGFEAARLEAELLLAAAVGENRAWLIAHAGEVPPAAAREAFLERVARRLGGEPVAWILACREFWSLEVEVTPATLIPRPETELLVELALARLRVAEAVTVADLGTGSGVLAIAIARERPAARVIATDLSEAALEVARRNVQRLLTGERVELLTGRWWQPLAGRRFDLVVSNPPYVADDDPHLQRGDVRHEPRLALASGADGLDAIREIVAGAGEYLRPGGWLLLEHGFEQGEAVRTLLDAAGLVEVQTVEDLAGHPRATLARRP